MQDVVTFIGIVGLGSLIPCCLMLRRRLSGTTLVMAQNWALTAIVAWCAAWCLSRLNLVTGSRGDFLWYAVSVLWLCPPIAVLGARRPTVRVWGWFVLLPLILVFAWPAATDATFARLPIRWSLEEPILVGYALVLLMGSGNYAFGRGWWVVLGYVVAGAVLILPLTPFAVGRPIDASACRATATFIVIATAWLSFGMIAHRSRPVLEQDPLPGFNRVWRDFRTCFGLVWSHRIRETFNETARKSGWPVVLSPSGLETTTGVASIDSHLLAEIEHMWRWMMRRFVDPEWIDRRLRP